MNLVKILLRQEKTSSVPCTQREGSCDRKSGSLAAASQTKQNGGESASGRHVVCSLFVDFLPRDWRVVSVWAGTAAWSSAEAAARDGGGWLPLRSRGGSLLGSTLPQGSWGNVRRWENKIIHYIELHQKILWVLNFTYNTGQFQNRVRHYFEHHWNKAAAIAMIVLADDFRQGGGIHGGALRAEHGTISGWCSVVYIWKY